MRILVVANSMPPKVGGSQVSVALTVRGLVDSGASVYLITSNTPDEGIVRSVEASGGRVFIPSPSGPDATWDGRILPLSNAISDVVSDHAIEVVHAYSHGTAISAAIALTGNSTTLLFASFHEMSSDQDIAGRARSKFAHNLGRINAIIPLSDYFEAVSRRYADEGVTIMPAREGLDVDAFRCGDRTIGQSLLGVASADVPVIVYPARWVPAKAQHDLVQAFSGYLADAKPKNSPLLKLVGSSSASPHVDSGAYKRELEELIASLQLSHLVDFVTDVSRQDMPHVYAAADLVVAPSHREGLGYVGLEAMASGTPVLTSRNTGFSQYCTNEINCLTFDVGDVDHLRQLLVKCLDGSFDPSALLENGLRTADAYSYRQGVDDLFSIYESALNDNCSIAEQ